MSKIIDLHCDTITLIQAGIDIEQNHTDGHLDIPRLIKGNVGCQIFACFISSMVPEDHAYEEAVKLLDLTDQTCEKYDKQIQKVENVEQIKIVTELDKIAVLPAIENGHVIANDLKKLEKLRLLGAKYLTLTHMKNLKWAVSSGEARCDFEGLTEFGEKVIAAMNETGIIIDISHVHESTFWAVLKRTRRPVIASHSNTYALCPAARNLTDDQIKAIADSGGMIGINFFPGFLSPDYLRFTLERCSDLFASFDTIEKEFWQNPLKKMSRYRELNKEFKKRMSDIRVGYDAIVNHISYIISLVGDDFVGFGSDFDGLPALPEGMGGCDIYPAILSLLKKNGFSETTIDKICQQNFLRILNEHD